MVLTTERLRIEPLRSQHAGMVYESLQESQIYSYIPEDPPTKSDLQRRYDYLENACSPDGTELWLNWVVFLRDSQTPIGTLQASLPQNQPASFAYIVFPRHWRQGYAREMTDAMLHYLFDVHSLPSVYAEIDTRNIASIRLVESLGLSRVATTREADFFKGASSDEYKYAVSREDWLLLNPPRPKWTRGHRVR